MLRLHNKITINGTEFTAIVELEAVKTWQTLTDTATVTVPNNFQKDNQPVTVGQDGFFKRGHSIKIEAGYFPNLNVIFEGYIRRIIPGNLITIEAEDASFLLKDGRVTKGLKDTDLDELLGEIIPSTVGFENVSAKLGDFRIKNATAAQVLEELKKTYSLITFFKGDELRVGLAYYPGEGEKHTFYLEGEGQHIRSVARGDDQNVGLIIDDDLEYIGADEFDIKIQGVSMQKDNTKIELYASFDDAQEVVISESDPGGGQVEKIGIPGLDKADLTDFITERLKLRLNTGIRGSFTTFLEPFVNHGDEVTIKSEKNPEKEGTFLVKKVTPTAGTSGGRQVIELDREITS